MEGNDDDVIFEGDLLSQKFPKKAKESHEKVPSV